MKKMSNIIKENKGLLLVAGGIGAVAAGVVMSKKASLKCTEIMKEHKATEEIIEECAKTCDEYSEEDRVRDHVINRTQTAIKLVKNYAIPYTTVVIGGCMLINGTYRIVGTRRVAKVAKLVEEQIYETVQ